LNCIAQKEIYVNDNLVPIPEQEFKRELKSNEYAISYNLDTINLNVRLKRETVGKISIELRNEIAIALQRQSGISISDKDRIIINYFPGIDKCNNASEPKNPALVDRYFTYSQAIRKIENVKQFFVYKTVEGTKSYGSKIKWIIDAENLIERTFFKLPYPCGSFVIINASGDYTSYKGEYNIDWIIPKL